MDDVVEATILAANSSLSGEIINIGAGCTTSVNEVVRLLNTLLDKHIQPTHGPAKIEPRSTLAGNAKAKKLLRWKPKISFEQGLQLTVKTALHR